jgi:hypothetical protein
VSTLSFCYHTTTRFTHYYCGYFAKKAHPKTHGRPKLISPLLSNFKMLIFEKRIAQTSEELCAAFRTAISTLVESITMASDDLPPAVRASAMDCVTDCEAVYEHHLGQFSLNAQEVLALEIDLDSQDANSNEVRTAEKYGLEELR